MEQKSKLTLLELEKYRNSEGFIDMDKFFLENPVSVEREKVGSIERRKDWLELKDTRILLKTESEEQFNGEENGQIYTDLIVSKLAEQVGLEAAYTDLIILDGKKGIFSKDVRGKDETLKTLRDYIGDDKSVVPSYEDITDIEYVYENIFEGLENSKITNESIKKVINEFNKLLTFDVFIMATDNHTENIGFLESIDENGDKVVKLSGIFDRENSLTLDMPFSDMEKISKDMLKISEITRMQDPKIAIIPNEEDEKEENTALNDFFLMLKSQVNEEEKETMWEMTLDYLSDYPGIEEFITNKCMNLNISKAISEVEKQIKSDLPKVVKDMAIKSFEERKDQISYYLGLDIEEEHQEPQKTNIKEKEKEKEI